MEANKLGMSIEGGPIQAAAQPLTAPHLTTLLVDILAR